MLEETKNKKQPNQTFHAVLAILTMIVMVNVFFRMLSEGSNKPSYVDYTQYVKAVVLITTYDEVVGFREEVANMEPNQANISFINNLDGTIKKGYLTNKEYIKFKNDYRAIKENSKKLELIKLIKESE